MKLTYISFEPIQLIGMCYIFMWPYQLNVSTNYTYVFWFCFFVFGSFVFCLCVVSYYFCIDYISVTMNVIKHRRYNHVSLYAKRAFCSADSIFFSLSFFSVSFHIFSLLVVISVSIECRKKHAIILLAIPNPRPPIRKISDCVRQRIFVASISPVDQRMDAFDLSFHVNIYQPYHFSSNRNL